jgi:hypothetical protein
MFVSFLRSSSLSWALAACLVVYSANACATPISWGGAQSISGDTDVNTTGSLVYAYQFSTSRTQPTTVNSVQFQPFNVPLQSTTATVGDVTLTAVNDNGFDAVFYSTDSDTSASTPFADLSANYQSLLGSSVISVAFDTDPGQPMSILLGGLTPGKDYLVQLWSSSTSWWIPTETEALGNANVTLNSNTSGVSGGVGQYSIGAFTAATSSQTFTLQGLNMYSPAYNFPLINALQVREAGSSPVPEIDPAGMGSVLALVTGALGLLERRRLKVA